MSRKKIQISFVLFSFILMVTACGQEDNPAPGQSAAAAAPDFATISTQILQPKCVSCHTTGNASGGVDLSSYSALIASQVVTPGSPAGSTLYTETQSGAMPVGGPRLSDTELAEIASWIQEGALSGLPNPSPSPSVMPSPSPSVLPSSSPSPSPTPSPSPIPSVSPSPLPSNSATFSWVNSNVIQQRCISCHSGFGNYAGLLNIVVPGDAQSSPLFIETNSGSMPPSGSKLSSTALQNIAAWINAGALNN